MLNFINSILTEIILIPITFVLGLGLAWIKSKATINKFKKKIKIVEDEVNIQCFTANTEQYDSNECVTLGYIFEYMAVGELRSAFYDRYKKVKFSCKMSLHNFSQIQKKYFHNNLIIIGGPFHNSITKEIFDQHGDDLPFHFGQDASLTYEKEGKSISYKPELFTGKDESKFYETDYALILNLNNPYTPGKRLIVLIGCRSIGCYGAAVFLANSLEKKQVNIVDDEYAIIIKCEGEEESLYREPVFIDYLKLNVFGK